MDSDGYLGLAVIVGGIAFLATWIYAIATYGFFLGVGFGWIPALVIGAIIGLLWPVVLLLAIGAVALILRG